METARRGLRFVRAIWRGLASGLLLLWYKAQYRGFRAGRGVTLGRGVYISLPCGGRLILGDNVRIAPNVHITADGGTIEIGDDSYIGDGAVIVAIERIAIGKDALIAAYATIRDQDHGYDRTDLPFRAQPLVSAPIAIEANVWLGTHVSVLKGVTIGSGAIVGANAVVTRDVAPRTVCLGVPARPVRTLS